MKKIISLLFLIIAVQWASIAQSHWTALTSGTNEHLYSVFSTDYNTAYTVGGNSNIHNETILKTTDGGGHWSSETSGGTHELFSVYFINKDTGYAVGDSGTIIKTMNAGANWSAQSSGTTNALTSVYFVNANIGYAVGNVGTIIKTTNGGASWTSQTSPTLNTLNFVFFTDENTGYIAGYGPIIKTTNGGATWSTLSTIVAYFMCVNFIDSYTGYATSSGGTIIKTTNAGASWTLEYSGTTLCLSSIKFIDYNTGFTVGNGGEIMMTTNGGDQWVYQVNSGTNNWLNSVSFSPHNGAFLGYAVGNFGTIVKTTACSNPYGAYNPQTICEGESYVFNGNTYTTPGLHQDVIHTDMGCDSIVYTYLSVMPVYNIQQQISICLAQSYNIGTHSYTAPGTYIDTLTSMHGCDSIVTTELTLIYNYSTSLNTSICEGHNYTYNNHIYTSTGTYSDTLHAIDGHDSIIVIHLTVNPVYDFTHPVTICLGENYTINGHTYTSTGTYHDTIQTISGCDSSITTNLTVVIPVSQFDLGNDTSFCNSFLLDAGSCDNCWYLWQNSTNSQTFSATETGHYWVYAGNYCGFVHDTINLTLLQNPSIVAPNDTLICKGNSATLSASGVGTIFWSTGDTINTLVVTPEFNSAYTVYSFNVCGIDSAHVIVSVTPRANAGVDTTGYVCTNITPVANLNNYLSANHQPGGTWYDDDLTGALYGPHFVTQLATMGNNYHFTYVVNGGSTCPNDSATITLFIDICNSIQKNILSKINIYPNPANNNFIIELLGVPTGSSNYEATVEIINQQSQIIKKLALTNSKNIIDIKELSSGIYTIRIKSNNEIVVKKLIKE